MILSARPERDDERGLQLYSFDEVSSSEVADQYLKWLNDLEVTSPIGSPVLLQEKSEKMLPILRYNFIDITKLEKKKS